MRTEAKGFVARIVIKTPDLHRFRANQVRLRLRMIPYSLGNL
jgi:hypothetical protein